jgi:hypothetical protein
VNCLRIFVRSELSIELELVSVVTIAFLLKEPSVESLDDVCHPICCFRVTNALIVSLIDFSLSVERLDWMLEWLSLRSVWIDLVVVSIKHGLSLLLHCFNATLLVFA